MMHYRNSKTGQADEILSLVDASSKQVTKVWRAPGIRTLADALEKLCYLGCLGPDDFAQIQTLPMRLPDGSVPSLIAVIGPRQREGVIWRVAVPPSAHFYANSTRGDRQRYEIEKIADSTVDADGNVEMRSGLFLHSVEFVPSDLPYRFSQKQRDIIRQTITYVDPQMNCYRSPDKQHLPNLMCLDFSKLPTLHHPHSLKGLERHIRRSIPDVSRQSIAATLEKIGMRTPRSGGRRAKPA